MLCLSFLFSLLKKQEYSLSCWLWLFKEQFILIIALFCRGWTQKAIKYLPPTQESGDKFTAKHTTAASCFIYEEPDFHSPWQGEKKVTIHPNSQAETVSLAIYYHPNEEKNGYKILGYFLSSYLLSILFFFYLFIFL